MDTLATRKGRHAVRLALKIAISAFCLSSAVRAEPGKAGGRECGENPGPSPFENGDAAHILIADFSSPYPGDKDFADSVSEQIDAELRQFEEVDLRNMPVQVPAGHLEFRRLRCYVKSHDEAEKIAEQWSADLVIWGRAYCNTRDRDNTRVVQNIVTGPISAKGSARVFVGRIGKLGDERARYSVCPSATLHRRDASIRNAGHIDIPDLSKLELPVLESSAPFKLVRFAIGLHFFDDGKPWIAARFFDSSADDIVSSSDSRLNMLRAYLAASYLDLPGGEDKARRLSERVLGDIAGSNTLLEASIRHNIGKSLSAQAFYDDSLRYYREAIDILKSNHANQVNIANVNNSIGMALLSKAHYKDALDIFEDNLRVDRSELGEQSANSARDYCNIGQVWLELANYDKALSLFLTAHNIQIATLGHDNPEVAVVDNNIGVRYLYREEYDLALKYLHEAEDIDERTLGVDHSAVGRDKSHIALALLEKKDYANATIVVNSALAIDKRALGKSHPRIARELNTRGEIFRLQGDHRHAIKCYRKSLKIFDANKLLKSSDAANVTSNLGLSISALGENRAALRHLNSALTIHEGLFGRFHAEVAKDHVNIASIMLRQKRYKDACPHFQIGLTVDEKIFGHTQAITQLVQGQLGLCMALRSGFRERKNMGVVVLGLSDEARSESPALELGDWLLAYDDGTKILNFLQFRELLKSRTTNQDASLVIVRAGKKISLPTCGLFKGVNFSD